MVDSSVGDGNRFRDSLFIPWRLQLLLLTALSRLAENPLLFPRVCVLFVFLHLIQFS